MAALEEDPALRTGVSDHAKSGRQVGASLRGWQLRLQRRELAGRRDRQMRRRKGLTQRGRQQLPLDDGGRQARDVVDRGVHRAGGADAAALVMGRRFAVDVPAVREVCREVGPPDQAGARHPERREQPTIHLGADIQAEALLRTSLFDDELQQDDAVARVGVASARLEVELQPSVRLEEAEVGEAGGVCQQPSRRQAHPAAIIFEIGIAGVAIFDVGRVIGRQRLRQIGGNRRIEIEPSFVDQLQHHVGECRLRERRAVHDGVGLQRCADSVAGAEGGHVDDAPAIDHRERQSTGAGGGHRLARLRVDRRSAGKIVTSGCSR